LNRITIWWIDVLLRQGNVSLTGDTSADLRLLEKGDVIIFVSLWGGLQIIGLFSADEVQLVGPT
jgi:hypothetical protein